MHVSKVFDNSGWELGGVLFTVTATATPHTHRFRALDKFEAAHLNGWPNENKPFLSFCRSQNYKKLSSDWDWDLGPWTLDLGPGTWDLGPWTLDLGPGTLDLGPGNRVENQESRIENWESRIETMPSPSADSKMPGATHPPPTTPNFSSRRRRLRTKCL